MSYKFSLLKKEKLYISPLDLTVNRTSKRIEQDDSAEYISAEITRCLQISPRIDDFKVNTGKPILRNMYAKRLITLSDQKASKTFCMARVKSCRNFENSKIIKKCTEHNGL